MLLTGAISLSTLSGCTYELTPEEEYEELNATEMSLDETLVQTIEVPDEEFKLVAEYALALNNEDEDKIWRITADKFLYLKVNTENLPNDTQVYIDNIHIDTSIRSYYACIDGIKQDEMDDHIHNSQMVGFPIGDNIYYHGVNSIEGSNETFIKGTVYGYNNYINGSIDEKKIYRSYL